MESDTKKKRGRPQTIAGIMADEYLNAVVVETDKRAAMNFYYACTFLRECYGRPENGSFFISEHGKVRRQGIAEQLGRMLEAELITIEQAKELAQEAEQEYKSGKSVKEIAKALAFLRQALAAEIRAAGNPN